MTSSTDDCLSPAMSELAMRCMLAEQKAGDICPRLHRRVSLPKGLKWERHTIKKLDPVLSLDYVAARHRYLQNMISDANRQLDVLRSNCPHTNHQRTYMADTGNYDRSLDRYWVQCCCPHCGRIWTEDQR